MLAMGLMAGVALGQSGGPPSAGTICFTNQLRFRFATGGDDLRGGQDNLNIVVFFNNGTKPKVAANVNASNNWPNNSVNLVTVNLETPVSISSIKGIRLIHIADGGFQGSLATFITPAAPVLIAKAFQSPDNWNMADVEVAALDGNQGERIAQYGFHRFTGSDTYLDIATEVPPRQCEAGGSLTGAAASRGRIRGAIRNEDVLRMVRAGTPEAEIIAQLRSRDHQFTLTRDTMLTLHRQGVSTHILNYMALPPARPHPPGQVARANANGLPAAGNGMLLGGGQTALPGSSAMPPPAGSDSALVPAVQRPALADGSITDGTRRTTAPTGAAATTAPATAHNNSSLVPAVQRGAITDGNLSNGSRQFTPQTGGSQIMSATGPGSTLGVPHRPPTTVTMEVSTVCARNPGMKILGISGGTPLVMQPAHLYKITGCSFGASNPQTNAVLLWPPENDCGSHCTVGIFLDVVSWNDNTIVVSFPSDQQFLDLLWTDSQIGANRNMKLMVQTASGDATYQYVGYNLHGN